MCISGWGQGGREGGGWVQSSQCLSFLDLHPLLPTAEGVGTIEMPAWDQISCTDDTSTLV